MICRSTLFSSLIYYSYSSLLSSPLYSTTPTPLYSTTLFLSILLLLYTLLFFSLCLLTVSIYMFVKQLLLGGSAGVFQPCGSSQFLSSMFGKQQLLFLHLFLSMFVKQLLIFLVKSPLSSPLLSFVLPMMKLSKSIHYMEYELMIKNLWGTWHHYQPPLHYLLYFVLWCLDAPSSWSNDEWHVSEASTTTTRFFIYCCFIWLLWVIDLFDFLYLLAYPKHIFLHLLEQNAK